MRRHQGGLAQRVEGPETAVKLRRNEEHLSREERARNAAYDKSARIDRCEGGDEAVLTATAIQRPPRHQNCRSRLRAVEVKMLECEVSNGNTERMRKATLRHKRAR